MKTKSFFIIAILISMALACAPVVDLKTDQDQDQQEQEDPQDPGKDTPEENESDDQDEGDPSGTGKDEDVDSGASADDSDILVESDFDKAITIVWNGSDATVTNETKLAVTKDGAHITIGAPGAEGKKVRVNMSGTTTDGSLKIYNGVKADDTNKKIMLYFDGVSLASKKGPAVNIQSGKTVYVVLADGKTSTLADPATYEAAPEGEDAKGCFFSEKQLVFSGNGKLNVEGNSKHAICVDDYVRFLGGEIVITKAVSDGLHANDYVRMDAGSLKVTSVGECVQCEEPESGYFLMTGGEMNLSSTGEKCGAVETASDILIEGGKLTAYVSGAASKCLKSDNNLTIKGGDINLRTSGGGTYDSVARDASAAACVRAENICTIAGGNVVCKSEGAGGKGINCFKFICEAPAVLAVTTAGSTYKYSTYTCRPKAIKATSGVVINGGDINILTTGTEGEGIESKTTVEVNGGTIAIQAKDDGINAAQTVTFNGGYTFCYATSNDGIDSNYNRSGSIVFNGGVVMAHSAASPEEGFDADSHANLTFNGGFVFCTGGQQGGGGGGGGGGRPGPGGSWGGGTTGSNPVCSQPTFMWNKAVSVGYFTITDASGKVVMSCYVPRALSTNYSLVSAPLTEGQTYKYGVVSSAPSGATQVFGKYFYQDGTVSGLSSSFTAKSGYTTL